MVNIRKLNQANIYIKNKDYESAEKIYYELLHDYPESDLVLSFWGYYNLKIGKLTKAEKILERAYNKRKTAPTISALALTKDKLEKFDDAVILYEELLKFDNNENTYKSIIECFYKLDMQMFLDAYVKKMLSMFPENSSAYSYVINKYISMGQYKLSESYCAIALEKFPNESIFWIDAGILQEVLYNNEECARECYISALDLGNTSSYYHLGVSLKKIGDFEKSEKIFKEGISKNVMVKETECSLGLLYLQQKRFKEGYEHYLKRNYKDNNLSEVWNDLDKKFDNNENILVYSDQGIGDGIMFSRYLPYLKKDYENIIVQTRKPIINILERSYPDIIFKNDIPNIEEYKNVIVLSDLPAYLDMDFDNIPDSDGYLKTDEEKQKLYKEKYFNNDKFKIGFCWKAGSMAIRDHINRTVNIEYLNSMFETFKNDERIQFYSLQKEDIFDGLKKYPQMIDVSEDLNDFDDTASIIKNLDLLITVDTSLVHVSGAIGGVDTVLLIPYCSDWRWFENTEKTEWYSSVKIIKQIERQEWFKECDKVIELINRRLND